jgi:hypothetical protein
MIPQRGYKVMPMAMGRKGCGLEKVENLCRTARVQNDSINTSRQFRSRLRDACGTDREVRRAG